jgi:MYXO-CTERM domain-containing protein
MHGVGACQRAWDPQHGTVAAVRITTWLVVGVSLAGGGIAAGNPGGGAPVMGGGSVPEGSWRDTAAVLIGGQAACTGVLIAPTVALTAGHCNDSQLTAILVGTNDLSQPARGERLTVSRRIQHPNYSATFDITVLELATASTVEPRAIATGWARADIRDGAFVQLVGFGAINRNASQYIDAMQEAETTITDADCENLGLGCNPGAQPAGELGAGGMGIDTCPGDSGGPLYLKTEYGDFLAGITSRGYSNATFPCQDGGLYVRPDAIVDWIEEQVGVGVGRGPEPSSLAIEITTGDGGETEIEVNDPLSEEHTFDIPEQPAFGLAAVKDDGRVRYCANPDFTGEDTVGVAIADASNPDRRLIHLVKVNVSDGEPPDDCSLEFASGGCCSTGTRPELGAALPFIVVGGVLLRRRRKR